ncbi:hypothetical protein CR164_08290 [Prosthecochloris marina]|uniref:Uncharacterized protein n=1 Tax=Prosthecochloris marina TaxID=2017681 RepID=A0A317T6C4_9CHLB|nr:MULTISPECIES: hypothetical protein [Prosthecochloris]PWW81810.1 hypothetical protein CR164_08290 [Prosthecochloris marina]
MMNKNYYTIVSSILFILVALLHLVRALMGWDVAIGDYMLPVGRSWVVFGIILCLGAWGIRGSKGYIAISAILFALVALLHLYRVLVTETIIIIDSFVVPLSASWVGFVISTALSAWGFLTYKAKTP